MSERDKIIKELKKAGHSGAAEYLRLTGEHKLTKDDIEIQYGFSGDTEVWSVFDIRPLKLGRLSALFECDVLAMVYSEAELIEKLEKLGIPVRQDTDEIQD